MIWTLKIAQEISLKLIVFANTVKAYNYLVKETNKLIKAEIEQYSGIKY
jgi:hypothetical protein